MVSEKNIENRRDVIIPGPRPEKLTRIKESRALETAARTKKLFASGDFIELGKECIHRGEKDNAALLFAQGYAEEVDAREKAFIYDGILSTLGEHAQTFKNWLKNPQERTEKVEELGENMESQKTK